VSGPSRLIVADAEPKAGTGFGANGTSAEVVMIWTGVTPLLTNCHDTVV
jgi:hypothetical protein